MGDDPQSQQTDFPVETSLERERPLDADSSSLVETAQPPANLEAVREKTENGLQSGLKFWESTFGRENNDKTFMDVNNGDRRALLKKASEVISDNAVFAAPEDLNKLLAELKGEEPDLSPPTLTDGVDVVDSGPDGAGEDVAALQEEILTRVNELFFEQLFADLFQCTEAVKQRNSEVAGLLAVGTTGVPKDKLQEAVTVFDAFSTDSNMLEQYLAHGEALMEISLRSSTLGEGIKAHLVRVVTQYANDSGATTLGPTLELGGNEQGDPLAYYQKERKAVAGDALFGTNFERAKTQYEAAITAFEMAPSLQAKAEVEQAQAELQKVVTEPIEEPDQPETNPVADEPEVEESQE